MTDAIPASIKSLLDDYIALMQTELPGYMTACYLQGSVALDAYQPPLSDIDYLTVISRRSTDQDIERLTALHKTLREKYPDEKLSGGYLQVSDLGKFTADIEKHPEYDEGTLHASAHHDINSITWWILKNKGVTVFGAPAETLNFTVDWDKLVADTRENLNTYWVTYIRNPQRVAWLLTDYGVQWTVLGVLRQYYTFKANGITSKVGAGEYALKNLPPKWHKIIQEAINIRNGSSTSLYRAKLGRALDAYRFLRTLIHLCNTTL